MYTGGGNKFTLRSYVCLTLQLFIVLVRRLAYPVSEGMRSLKYYLFFLYLRFLFNLREVYIVGRYLDL